MESKQYSVALPTDDKGYLGRKCPKCNEYFKVKLGTGLKDTKTCICPYCEHNDESTEFITQEQYEYARSITIGKVKTEVLGLMYKQFKSLEFGKSGDLIKLKITTPPIPQFPIKYFNERTLETEITCDNCQLDFAVYGVFGNCPDCGNINAFTVFKKSIERGTALLELIHKQKDLTTDIMEIGLKSILNHLVSSFDSLGKQLRKKYSSIFPQRPKNLFQNTDELKKIFLHNFKYSSIEIDYDFDYLKKLFQVRHVFEHNMGVVDEDYTSKVSNSKHMEGKKYNLTDEELQQLMATLIRVTSRIEKSLSEAS